MAITYVGGNSGTAAANADVSVDLTALAGGSDAAAATGDLVIFAYGLGDADNVDLDVTCNTTGFSTNEVADLFGNGTEDANLGVYWKFMTATPDTAVVGEGSTGGNDTALSGIVMVFRGVETVANGGPFRAAATTATGTTGGNPDPASISGAVSGDWVVIAGCSANAGTGTSGTFTNPTNYTTDSVTLGADDTTDVITGMGYRTDPANPENPGAMTQSVSGTGWAAVTMLLREAVVVPLLVIPDAAIAVAADNVALTQHNVLVVADAALSLAADGNLALTQHNVLAVQEAAIALAADGNLQLGVSLIIPDAAIAVAADNLDLTAHEPTGVTLEMQDAALALAADNVALTQHNVLAVADSAIALAADNLDLVRSLHVLTVQDAGLALAADGDLVLIQHNVLAVDDAALALVADNVSLSIPGEEGDINFSDQGGGAYYSRS